MNNSTTSASINEILSDYKMYLIVITKFLKSRYNC